MESSTVAADPAQRGEAAPSAFAGPWFMSPSFERMLAARNLSAEDERQVRAFAEDGFLVIDDLGLPDFDLVAERVKGQLGPMHEDGAFNRIADGWTISDEIRSIATAPAVLGLLELLYGRKPIPFSTLNFYRGSQQPTHSDAVHFHCFPRHYMCGVWVALEDTDDRNGALHYYPGTHLLPDVEYADLGVPPGKDFHQQYVAYVRELIDGKGLRKEKPFMRKGQAVIWAANLLHGGDPIAEPDSTRWSQVNHYYFENCSYYTPLRSDLARGKVFFRQITDVRTGNVLPARVNGRRVPVPPTARLAAMQRAVLRKLGRGSKRHPA